MYNRRIMYGRRRTKKKQKPHVLTLEEIPQYNHGEFTHQTLKSQLTNHIKVESPSKIKTSEISIQSDILTYLLFKESQDELVVQRINNIPVSDKGTYRSLPNGVHRGFPDILVFKNGKTIFIEVKSNNGKMSEYQKDFAELIIKQGFEYYLVRSLDFVIKEIGL